MVDTRIGPLGHHAASPAREAHGSEIAFALIHHPPIMGNPVQGQATKKKIVTPNSAQVSHHALKGFSILVVRFFRSKHRCLVSGQPPAPRQLINDLIISTTKIEFFHSK